MTEFENEILQRLLEMKVIELKSEGKEELANEVENVKSYLTICKKEIKQQFRNSDENYRRELYYKEHVLKNK